MLSRPEKPEGVEVLKVTWNGEIQDVDWEGPQPEDYDFQCPFNRTFIFEDEDPECRLRVLRRRLEGIG